MIDLEPIRDSADHLLDGTLEDCVRSAGKARRDLLALIAEVEQLHADRAALEVRVELYETALRAIARRHGDTLGVGAILRSVGFELGPGR